MLLVSRFRNERYRPAIDGPICLDGREAIDHYEHLIIIPILFHTAIDENEVAILDRFVIDDCLVHGCPVHLDGEDIPILYQPLGYPEIPLDILIREHGRCSGARRTEYRHLNEVLTRHSLQENPPILRRAFDIPFLFQGIEIDEEASQALQTKAEPGALIFYLAYRRHLPMFRKKLLDRLENDLLFLRQDFHMFFLSRYLLPR